LCDHEGAEISTLGHSLGGGDEGHRFDRDLDGYRHVPQIEAESAPAIGPAPPLTGAQSVPLKVGVLQPDQLFGGAELWLHDLMKHSSPARIQWQVAPTHDGYREQRVVDLIAQHGAVHSSSAAIDVLARTCDILVAWRAGESLDAIRRFSGPVVLVSHGCVPWSWYSADPLRHAATHFVAVSELAAQSFGPAPVRVIPAGVDPERCVARLPRETVRAGWGLAPDEIAIGYVGRLSAEKNCPAVARAARLVGRPFRPVFVGGAYDPAVADELRGLSPDAIFVPPMLQIGDALAALDVLLMASPSEGACLVVLEAMLAGLPVVATPVGLLPEITAQHGTVAALVPLQPTDHELAVAVRQALSPDWQSVIPHARHVVEQHYTAQRMANAWMDFLEQRVALCR
jgi:glycosyltransferase involved in cell wall biosynthesis